MSRWVSDFTKEQREAIVSAHLDRGLPLSRAIGLAQRGELEGLEPYAPNEGTARGWCVREKKRREAAKAKTPIATLKQPDQLELLRTLAVDTAYQELENFRKQQKTRPKDTNPERLRQIVRVIREAAALPGPGEQRPPAPGQKRDGVQHGGQTRDGMAAELLKAHRSNGKAQQGRPAQDAHKTHTHTENTTHRSEATEAQDTQTAAQPGSRESERAAWGGDKDVPSRSYLSS